MTDRHQTSRESELTSSSRVRIGQAIAAAIFLFGVALEGFGMYRDLCARIDLLQQSQFTRDDQLRWSLELKNQNPEINVPVPYWVQQESPAPHASRTNRSRLAITKP
jgi:2-methylcitrate dehydratase PrpD